MLQSELSSLSTEICSKDVTRNMRFYKRRRLFSAWLNVLFRNCCPTLYLTVNLDQGRITFSYISYNCLPCVHLANIISEPNSLKVKKISDQTYKAGAVGEWWRWMYDVKIMVLLDEVNNWNNYIEASTYPSDKIKEYLWMTITNFATIILLGNAKLVWKKFWWNTSILKL